MCQFGVLLVSSTHRYTILRRPSDTNSHDHCNILHNANIIYFSNRKKMCYEPIDIMPVARVRNFFYAFYYTTTVSKRTSRGVLIRFSCFFFCLRIIYTRNWLWHLKPSARVGWIAWRRWKNVKYAFDALSKTRSYFETVFFLFCLTSKNYDNRSISSWKKIGK